VVRCRYALPLLSDYATPPCRRLPAVAHGRGDKSLRKAIAALESKKRSKKECIFRQLYGDSSPEKDLNNSFLEQISAVQSVLRSFRASFLGTESVSDHPLLARPNVHMLCINYANNDGKCTVACRSPSAIATGMPQPSDHPFKAFSRHFQFRLQHHGFE